MNERGKPPRRSWPKRLVRLAVGFSVVVFVALNIHWSLFAAYFDVRIMFSVLAFQVGMIGAIYFYVARHALLVRIPPAPLTTAFEAVMLSAVLNLVTPARASEVVKATYLRNAIGIPLSSGISAIFVERLLDVLVVGALGVSGLAGMVKGTNWTFGLLAAAVCAALFLRPLATGSVNLLKDRKSAAPAFLHSLATHIESIASPRIASISAGITVLSWLCHVGAYVLFFRTLGLDLTLSQILLVFSTVTLAGAVPALPGGIGTIEGAATLVLNKQGLPFDHALSIALALHIGEVLLSIVVGPFIFVCRPSGVSALLRDIRDRTSSGI